MQRFAEICINISTGKPNESVRSDKVLRERHSQINQLSQNQADRWNHQWPYNFDVFNSESICCFRGCCKALVLSTYIKANTQAVIMKYFHKSNFKTRLPSF